MSTTHFSCCTKIKIFKRNIFIQQEKPVIMTDENKKKGCLLVVGAIFSVIRSGVEKIADKLFNCE